jgi:hypothetical protein
LRKRINEQVNVEQWQFAETKAPIPPANEFERQVRAFNY